MSISSLALPHTTTIMHTLTLIFATILHLFVSRTSGTPTKFKYPDDQEAPLFVACGGVLNASTTAIAYKPDDSISPNERCVWTITSADTRGYSLEVLSFGLQPQPGETGVTATCIFNYYTADVLNVQILQAGAVELDSTCSVLVITYYSGPNPGNSRGFVMLYTSTPGKNYFISPNSMQYVINDKEGFIRYPSTTCATYTEDELSTFVFSFPENTTYHPNRKSLVTYSLNSLGENCHGTIEVIKFSPEFGWVFNTSIPEDFICDDVQFRSWAIDDLLMLVFRSGTGSGYGFHLTYSSISLNFP
ncbi:unnamed protein product [Orchesella dallaii]|uniref:Cubilin n=1 Tax=Orchesella dallaii TaxID=48710 RepID=A0ABP1RLB0_9HEXA